MTLTLIRGAISDGYVYAYKSVLFFSVKSGNIHDTWKTWHNETVATYQFTGMLYQIWSSQDKGVFAVVEYLKNILGTNRHIKRTCIAENLNQTGLRFGV